MRHRSLMLSIVQCRDARTEWAALQHLVRPFLASRAAAEETGTHQVKSCGSSCSTAGSRSNTAAAAGLAARKDPTGSSSGSCNRFYWAISIVLSRSFSSPITTGPLVDKALLLLALQAAAALVSQALLQWAPSELPSSGGDMITWPLWAAGPILCLLGWVLPLGWAVHDLSLYLDSTKHTRALFPFIDLFNHRSGQRNSCAFDWLRGEVVLTAAGPVPAGQEVFNTYGELTNGELLKEYGFVELENPNDTTRLSGKGRSQHMAVEAAQIQQGTQIGSTLSPNCN